MSVQATAGQVIEAVAERPEWVQNGRNGLWLPRRVTHNPKPTCQLSQKNSQGGILIWRFSGDAGGSYSQPNRAAPAMAVVAEVELEVARRTASTPIRSASSGAWMATAIAVHEPALHP